jgi:hypothetical protein
MLTAPSRALALNINEMAKKFKISQFSQVLLKFLILIGQIVAFLTPFVFFFKI